MHRIFRSKDHSSTPSSFDTYQGISALAQNKDKQHYNEIAVFLKDSHPVVMIFKTNASTYRLLKKAKNDIAVIDTLELTNWSRSSGDIDKGPYNYDGKVPRDWSKYNTDANIYKKEK